MKLLSIAALSLALAACGSKSKPASTPPPDPAAPAVAADCADYEHQVDLCRATCEFCAGDAPGNSCNVCAEACADKIYCSECQAADHCRE